MKSTDKRGARAIAPPIAPLVAVMLTALVALPAAAGEPMTEAEITTMLSGATLDGIYYNHAYFTEVYHDDGTIRYWDSVAADSGEWSVQDGQFCTFYEGQEGACFTVERDGANCFTFYERDRDTGAIDPKKWTSRGWIRGRDNTCPDAPAAEL